MIYNLIKKGGHMNITIMNPIEKQRLIIGLSQQEVADKLNISRVAYGLKIRGKNEWLKREIDTLLEITGLTYEQLFKVV